MKFPYTPRRRPVVCYYTWSMNASSLHKHSFRLFARPSFLEGVARIFDFANVLQRYRYDTTEHAADANALTSDWMAVGDDLRHAIRTYERQSRA